MFSSSISSPKILLDVPLMAGFNFSCIFYLSTTNRAPFTLIQTRPSSGFTLNKMTQHVYLSFCPVLRHKTVQSVMPYKTANLIQGESEKKNDSLHERLILLKDKLNENGLHLEYYKPGQYNKLLCPKCLGGSSKERSFAVHIRENGIFAVWKCFRSSCGWVGVVQGEYEPFKGLKLDKPKKHRKITDQDLRLAPLNGYLINYFRERGISANTLTRNKVMQKITRYGRYMLPVIAFTYRRDGILINCKYRKLPKIWWQESGTEKILYGLDDIKEAKDIIIVEGEIDKLSIEEAGFKNCVSVPSGAPGNVSNKDLPDRQQDKRFDYLWSCNEYFKPASRIVLATDGDGPGHALAEELARRLGKERCWRVKWPMRNDVNICKDANEVLVHLGKQALRESIENAQIYPINGLFTSSDFSQEINELCELTSN